MERTDTQPGVVQRDEGEDTVQPVDDPAALQAELGPGKPLEGSVQSRMHSAFGQSFPRVRTHTDATARRLSAEQGARAFTIGEHIAFGAGQYRPGSVMGDALIAHELAHVTQQGTSSEATRTETTSNASQSALERDADASATGALASLWGRAKGVVVDHAPRVGPALRSGFRVQRCPATIQGGRRVERPSAGLSCPAGDAAAEVSEADRRRGLDGRARAIIDVAQDGARDVEERAREVVLRILCGYYPDELEKVNDIEYVADEPGLGMSTVFARPNVRGSLKVGDSFVRGTTEQDFARRVLQVGHELKHVDQWRAGMTGPDRSDEREFLAFHWEALTGEHPGTGRMRGISRVALIDGALGYYNCLSPEKQEEHRSKRDELLERRPGELGRLRNPANRRRRENPPTECQRP